MKMKVSIVVGLVGLVACLPIEAHHSFASVFDTNRPIEMKGTVTGVEWMNPHVWIYVDVENDAGEIENWGFEMGSPNGLVRRGWRHDTLAVGATVTLSGVRARDGSRRGAVRSVTLASGESLFGAQDESR
jgi:hypothetical protein